MSMTTATTTANSSKGSPNDDPTSDDSDNKDTNSSNYLQEDEDDPFTFRSRKSYPQRNNRSKLNYRDLERGVYDAHELRQSMWALGGPTELSKSNRNGKHSSNTGYSDDEDDDDIPAEEENDKSNDDTDQMHRRLWCICKKPWDHSRLMLRCDSCANWYHGDCIGVTKEQARVLDMNGDQFVCPPCRKVTSDPAIKPGRSSDESIVIKRKRIDGVSPSDRRVGERNENSASSKNLTHSEPSKRPKTGIFFQRDSSLTEPQIHCIVHGCSNWAKSGWVYCSAACIRRHINDTLQTIQRSKGANNDSLPSREDILLYESRTKKVLDQKLVPKVEDLCAWINQHPSYEIVKPALRQSILLTANQSKSSSQVGLMRPSSIATPTTPTTPNSTKPKLSWTPIAPNTKPIPIKKAPVQLTKQTSNTPTSPNIQNYADIRMKVPQALYDKLITRLEKSSEKIIPNEDIRVIVDKIEEEMYRVYGKVDNSYKNKFRSLLANISNMNNNFFYKHILSKEVTAKQIVAMKPEDMLPPEEKEKRKDEFEKEVQMIIQAGEQTAEEMARRARTKITRQGLIDNDAVTPNKEQISNEDKDHEHKQSKTNTETKKTESNTTSKSITKTKKPVTSTTDQKSAVKPKPKVQTSASNKDTTSSHGRHTFDINCSICTNTTAPKSASPKPTTSTSPRPTTSTPTETIPQPIVSLPEKPADEPAKLPYTSPIREELNPTFSAVDLDNDYIEPESPTGIDALLYDDDDDLNTMSTHSRSSRISSQQSHPESPGDNQEYLPPTQPTIRDDYNPSAASKPKTDPGSMYQPTPISRSSPLITQWRGLILPPDAKLSCQSVRTYGESDYLIGDIPEQLAILGRLRLGDLWDYIRDSLAVRDVIILTLISSNTNDNNAFSRYVDTMRTSGRAAVINKRTEPSLIRDMYVLAADIKDCPPNVISTLSLSNIDPKQLFLVIIGAGKRTNKTSNRSNENQSSSHFTYKPVSLQDSITKRDPRLLRNKDPRSHISETITTGNHTKDPSVKSTMQFSKSTERDDLFQQSAGETMKEAGVSTAVILDDNLNEENMEVDEEQDDKHKKQLMISEFNDVDYRFLDQDMDHRMPPIMPENDGRKNVFEESSFSDVLPSKHDADDRTIKSSLMGKGREKHGNDSDFVQVTLTEHRQDELT